MKNNLTVFQNEQFGQIRTIDEKGTVYFCGRDVAKALGYVNSNKALKDHCEKDGVTNRYLIDSMGRKQVAAFINEGNLYRLMTHSKLPEAEKFASWVYDEVLPSIRKTGEYKMPAKKKSDDDLKIQKAEIARINAEARLKNADTKQAQELLKIAAATDTNYKQVLHAYAANILTGQPILPLPEVSERTYSASEIAEILGVSANKIGRLANENGIKTEYYGKWFYDKSRHSDKQVETFRYFERAISVFRKLLEVAA